MNHLVGLKNVGNSTLAELSEEETAALEFFRKSYNAARPQDVDESSLPTFSIQANELPPCGWRSLDDSTLYRFLCADHHGGSFQMKKSLDRLKRALQFRKDCKADEILQLYEHLDGESSSASASASAYSSKERDHSPRSVRSLKSLASGTLSECGERVEDMQIMKDMKDKSISSSSSTFATRMQQLEKYKRLRVRVFTGRGYNGEPIMFERLGEFLGSGNGSLLTEQEWIHFYIWDLERHFTEMRQASIHNGKAIDKYIFCGDCSGIVTAIWNRSIWKVIPLLKALVKSVEEFYPEIAHQIVLYNVPKIATLFYRAVRSFLDPVTASKISLQAGLPTDYWQTIMPLEAIPEEYGGASKVSFPPTASS